MDRFVGKLISTDNTGKNVFQRKNKMLKKIISLLLILVLFTSPIFAENRWGNSKPPLGSVIDWSHPLSRGLVGCWLLNEGRGQQLRNLVDNSASNSFVSSPTWINSNRDSALRFNGTNNKVILGNAGQLQNIGKGSFAFVLLYRKKSAFTSSRGLINKTLTTVKWISTQIQSNKVYFTYDDDVTRVTITSTNTISITDWNHIVFMKQQGVEGSIWINGKKDPSVGASNGDCSSAGNVEFPVDWLGNFNPCDIPYVYIYNRALSPSEIQSLYVAPYQFIYRPSLYDLFTQTQEAAVRRFFMVQ